MSRKRRKRWPFAIVVPPELFEGHDGVYTTETDAEGRTTYILMGEMVLERMGQPRPSPDHRVRYKNGDCLDSRRENLEWYVPPIGPSASRN